MVLVWHMGQSGRTMVMMLSPFVQAGALPNSQSPVDTEGGGDGASMEPSRSPPLVNIAHFRKVNVLVETKSTRGGQPSGLAIGTMLSGRTWQTGGCQCRATFFDVMDGHRLFDASGFVCEDDNDAIIRATVLAIGVSLDTPEDDPERRIAIINDAGREIGTVPVYSRPSYENPAK
jgi:hypothetical protein